MRRGWLGRQIVDARPERDSRNSGAPVALLGCWAILLLAWLVLGKRSLWFDELYALYAAFKPWQDLVGFLRALDAHPPLYPALLKLWTSSFGVSELAVRAPSVLAGLATGWGLWALGRESLGNLGAATSVLALVASPLFVEAAVDATRYALLTALLVWAAREAWHLASGHRRAAWPLIALGTLMLYTHYLGAVLVASLGAFGIAAGLRGRMFRVLFVPGLLFAPWVPVLLFHLSAGRLAPPWRPPFDFTLFFGVVHVLGFGGRVAGTQSSHVVASAQLALQVAMAAPVVALWITAWLALRKSEARLAEMVACFVGIPVAFLLGASAWTGSKVAYPRYFVPVVPFLALAVGALAQGWGRLPVAFRKVGLAAGCFTAVLGVASLATFASNPTAGAGDRKELARVLASRLRVGDALLVYPVWEFLALDYYLPWTRGQYVVLPSVWSEEGTAKLRQAVSRAVTGGRIWVVQGNPISRDHFEALYGPLARTHQVRYSKDFDGIRLTLFERRE